MASKGPKNLTTSSSNGFNTKWLKNALKSVGLGYKEAIKTVSPNIYETAATGRDVTGKIIGTIRGNKSGQDRIQGTLRSNKYVQAMSKAYKNILTDFKDGNLAGTENRSESNSGFSFGEESSDEVAKQTEEMSASFDDLRDTVANSELASIKMQKATADATIAMTAASMQNISTIGTEVVNHLTNINSNLSAIVQYNNDNMTKFIESSLAYYDKMGQKAEEQSTKINAGDVMSGRNGTMNLGQYKKLVKQQFKDMASNSALGAVANLLSQDGMLDMLASNPLGFVVQGMSSYFLPKVMRASMESMEAAYNNFMPTFLTELSTLADDTSSGLTGTLRRAIGETFGLKLKSKNGFKEHEVERGAISFDGETKHAITEIITSELRDQTAYLKVIAEKIAGKKAHQRADSHKRYWSYADNDYVNKDRIDDIITERILENITANVNSTDFGQAFSQVRTTNDTIDPDTLDNAIMEVYYKMSSKNALTYEDLNGIIQSLHSSDNVKKVLTKHIETISKSNPNAYNNLRTANLKAISSRNNTLTEIENDNTGYNFRNSAYGRKYTADIKDSQGNIIHNKGDYISVDDRLDSIFAKNKKAKLVGRYNMVPTDNGAVDDVKGIIGTITKGMNEFTRGILDGKTGVDVIRNVTEIVGKHAGGITDTLKRHLFGGKDADGNEVEGVFSGMKDGFKDAASQLKYILTGKGYTDSKGNQFKDTENSVFGQLKKAGNVVKEGVMYKLFGKTRDENGEWIRKDDENGGIFGSIKKSFLDGLEGWRTAFFGEPGKDREATIQSIKDYAKENLPRAGAGAVIGAVGGMAAGTSLLGVITGGPLFGAALGAATGFLAKNEKFQTMLFGEKDEENGGRLGGIISRKTQDFFKKNKNAAIGGAAIGALRGTITGGGLLGTLVGGPIAGALLGTATGLAFKSEKIQEMLFGPEGEDGKRHGGIKDKIVAAFNKHKKQQDGEDKKTNKGMLAIGAGAGALSAAVIGKMGVIGAALTPAGPIGGALFGLALGIKAQTGNFKEWLFGKEDGLKHADGRTSKKQGVIGKIGNTINANIIRPLSDQTKAFWKEFTFTLKHDVIKPFAIFGEAVAEKAGEFFSDVKDTAKTTFMNIVNTAGDFLFGKKDENGNRQGGIFSPVINTVTKAGNVILTGARKIITHTLSVPGRLLKFGMGIVSSAVVEYGKKILSPVHRLIKDVRTVVFAGIKNVFKLAFKGIGGIVKVATAPFRFIGGLGLNILKDVGRGVGKGARALLGARADRLKERWEATNTGSLAKRVRNKLKIAKGERTQDKEKMKAEIADMRRHTRNAQFIKKYTKGQFSVDTDEARSYLRSINPKAYNKLITGQSEGKGWNPNKRNTSMDEDRNGIDITGQSLSAFDKMDANKMDFKSKVVYFLRGIFQRTDKVADVVTGEKREEDETDKVARHERELKKNKRSRENMDKYLDIIHEKVKKGADVTDAARALSRTCRIPASELIDAYYNKYYNGNNGEDNPHSKLGRFGSTGDFLAKSIRDFTDFFAGTKNQGGEKVNKGLLGRIFGNIGEAGKDMGRAVGKTAVGEAAKRGVDVVKAENARRTEIAKQKNAATDAHIGLLGTIGNIVGGQGGRGAKRGGRGILGSLIGTAANGIGSLISGIFGGDEDKGKSKNTDSFIDKLKNVADEKEKENEGRQKISDAEIAEEKRQDEGRKARFVDNRSKRNRAKTRVDMAAATNEGSADIKEAHRDMSEDMLDKASANAKTAKDLQKEKKEEKEKERKAKLDAITAAAAKSTSESVAGIGNILGGKGVKLLALGGLAGMLGANFPELVKTFGDIGATIVKHLPDIVDTVKGIWDKVGGIASTVLEWGGDAVKRVTDAIGWTNKERARTDGNNAGEQLEKNVKDISNGHIFVDEDGDITHMTQKREMFAGKTALNFVNSDKRRWYESKATKAQKKTFNAVKKGASKVKEGAGFVKDVAGAKLKGVKQGLTDKYLTSTYKKVTGKTAKNGITQLADGSKGISKSAWENMTKGMSKSEKSIMAAQDGYTILDDTNKLQKTKLYQKVTAAKNTVANIGKKAATKLSTKTGNMAEKLAEKGAKSKGMFGTIEKFISKFYKILSEKFAKKTGQKLVMKGAENVSEKGLKAALKRIWPKTGPKIIAKVSAILGAKGSIATATAGLSEVVFIGFGAINGVSGAAKLFQVDSSQVDPIMLTIAAILGGFEGTMVGGIISIVVELIGDVLGFNFFHELAVTLYKIISGKKSDKTKKLEAAMDDWKKEYKDYQDKEITKAWKKQLKDGTIPEGTTYEEFVQGLEDGTYKADYKSFQDWNANKNKSFSDRATSGISSAWKGIKGGAKKVINSAPVKAIKGVVGDRVWGGIKGAGKAVINAGKAGGKAIIKTAGGFVKNGFDFAKGVTVDNFNKFAGDVKEKGAFGIVTGGAKVFGNTVKNIYGAAKGAASLPFKAVGGFLEDTVGQTKFGKAVADKFNSLKQTAFAKAAGSVVDGVKKVVNATLEDPIGSITSIFKKSEKAGEAWSSVDGKVYVKEGEQWIVYTLSGEKNKSQEPISDEKFQKLKSAGLLSKLKDFKIQKKPKNLLEGIQNGLNTAGEALSGALKGVINTAKGIGSDIGGFFSGLFGKKKDNKKSGKGGKGEGQHSFVIHNAGGFGRKTIKSQNISAAKLSTINFAEADNVTEGAFRLSVLQFLQSMDNRLVTLTEVIGAPSSNTVNVIGNTEGANTQQVSSILKSISSGGNTAATPKKTGRTVGPISGGGIIGGIKKAASSVGNFFKGLFGGKGEADTLNGGTYYSQNDPSISGLAYGNDGSTMGDSGCGPAAIAMAASDEGVNVNPMQMAGLAQATGDRDETGTNWNFVNKAAGAMGLGSKQALNPSADYINSELDKGHSVVLSGMKGGYGGRGPSPYTNAGHYVVATGRDSDGNLIINDPRGKSYSGKFNAEDVASETGSAWTLGGGFGKLKKRFRRGGRGADWLGICAAVKKQMSKGKPGYYSHNGGKCVKLSANGRSGTYRTDCSGYVCACLYFYTGEKVFRGPGLTTAGLKGESAKKAVKKHGFSVLKWPGWGKLKPGDVMNTYGTGNGHHTQIFHSKGKVYSCGSSDAVNNPGPVNCSTRKKYDIIFRPSDPGSASAVVDETSKDTSASSSTSTESTVGSTGTVFERLADVFNNAYTKASNALFGIKDTETTTSSDSSGDSGSAGGTQTSAKGTAAKVWNWFTSHGYSNHATAGIMGNLYQESGLNPSSIQGNGKGPAAGIAQWENYNTKSARWKNLDNYAKKKGKKWTDLTTQLEFLNKEVNTLDPYFKSTASGMKKAGAQGTNHSMFKQSKDYKMATRQFEGGFERAGIPRMENRLKAAAKYYKKFAKGGKGEGSPFGGFGSVGGKTLEQRAAELARTIKDPKMLNRQLKLEGYFKSDAEKTKTIKQGIKRLVAAGHGYDYIVKKYKESGLPLSKALKKWTLAWIKKHGNQVVPGAPTKPMEQRAAELAKTLKDPKKITQQLKLEGYFKTDSDRVKNLKQGIKRLFYAGKSYKDIVSYYESVGLPLTDALKQWAKKWYKKNEKDVKQHIKDTIKSGKKKTGSDSSSGGDDSGADDSSGSDASVSSGGGLFERLGGLISDVFAEVGNRVFTGDKNTDYSSIVNKYTSGSDSSSGGSSSGGSSVADPVGGKSAKKGQTITLPTGLGKSNDFMGWQLIKSKSSDQYKLRQKAGQKFDKNGYGMINGRYTVATTSTFGKVGDYIDVKRGSGKTLKAIIADIKSPKDKTVTKWGHKYGQSVTEFVVDKDKWYKKDKKGRMQGYKLIKKNPGKDNSAVISITNQGSYFTKKGGKGEASIANRNFADAIGYYDSHHRHGGRGSSSSAKVISKSLLKRKGEDAASYIGVSAGSSSQDMLFNIVQILAEIAASSKTNNVKLDGISDTIKNINTTPSKSGESTNNYYVMKDGKTVYQGSESFTNNQSRSGRAEEIAIKIAQGGY